MYIADLHIHSRYSMATSGESDGPHLELWARKKGIGLVGTGDFTHPAWRQSLRESLEPEGNGLYTLKKELRISDSTADAGEQPRFVVTGEISSIYKRHGKTRKVHNLILLPGLDAAETLALALEQVGNIHSDGRPILGMDSYDLLALTLEVCPEAMFIPAHIWTPHFSLFGAFSGFDTMEECFGDLSGHIHALETGLSSDPAMNWQISALDGYTLVSNSDAHSPGKLGREGNLIDGTPSYGGLKRAIETGDGFAGTLEFFPEEGKYHLDGHRACGVCLTPEEAVRAGGRCPVCGKRLTIGVEHRIWELSDRQAGFTPARAKPFESIVPLPEIIAASLDAAATGRKVQGVYDALLRELGPEFFILRDCPIDHIAHVGGTCVAEGVRRLRAGKVLRTPGYDGEFGRISLFTNAERQALMGRAPLFAIREKEERLQKDPQQDTVQPALYHDPDGTEKAGPATVEQRGELPPNPAQKSAITASDAVVCVIAGPGTGKTKTLVLRIAYLVEQGISPEEITAVAFTNQAAGEMQTRLTNLLGKDRVAGMHIGTFHSVCMGMLDQKPIIGGNEAKSLMENLLGRDREKGAAQASLNAISRVKNGLSIEEAGIRQEVLDGYAALCRTLGVRDFDDLLLDGLNLTKMDSRPFTYLLIDEYQDINPLQRRLVEKWSKESSGLFVIGDADQSIYGFRGANADCFDALKTEKPEMRVIRLHENYRSTPEIMGAACHLIQHNPGGDRRLTPKAPSGPKVRLVRMESPFSEGVWISKEILKMTGGADMRAAREMERNRETLRAFSDMAVLCRTNRQLGLIEECLGHDGIPCVVSGRGQELCEDAVRGALGFFGFMLDQTNRAALMDCLTFAYGCSKEACKGLLAAPFTLENNPQTLPADFPEGVKMDAQELYPLLNTERPKNLIARWMAKHGESDGLKKLYEIAAFHQRMQPFLNALAIGEEGDILRHSGKSHLSGAVRLLTFHGSKGLEFPVVFCAGLTEGMLPYTRADVCENPQEERRLLFVGMTRAKQELILTAPEPPSPFLKELPTQITDAAVMEKSMVKGRQLSLF